MSPEPGSWQHDLVELLRTLGRHDVPFVVVGGYAVAHAGHLRGTKDIDILVPRTPEIDARLRAALSVFLGGEVAEADIAKAFIRLFVGRPGAVDFLRALPGVTWATAWKTRSSGTLFGHRVPFLGIDALIRNKRTVARHQDLADVEQLVRIRRDRAKR